MGLSSIVFSLSVVPLFYVLWSVTNGSRTGRASSDTLTLLCLWVSAVGLLVAWAAREERCARTTWLLGKHTSSGRVPLWSYLLFWPYHLGLRIKLWGTRKLFLASEPLWNEVLPGHGWFIGGWPSNPSSLPPGRPSVLDLTCELPRSHANRYMCIPVWDTRVPSLQQISEGVEWALREHSMRGAVYIHCAHGHGRSAMLLAACLLKTREAASLDHAVVIMQKARPRVKLSTRQHQQMVRWVEARLLQQAHPKDKDSSFALEASTMVPGAGPAAGLRKIVVTDEDGGV